jgi:hypothetical protein
MILAGMAVFPVLECLTGMKRTTARESKRSGAFSSEVDTGSREENASKTTP